MAVNSIQGQELEEGAVLSLAEQFHLDVARVRALYQKELAALAAQSRIKSFLPILCSRRVKAIIKREKLSNV